MQQHFAGLQTSLMTTVHPN